MPNASALKKPIRKRSTARGRTQAPEPNEVFDEYDFANSRQNPYAGRVTAGGMLVVVDADLVSAFPTSEAVNDALRVIAAAAARLKPSKVHTQNG